MRKYYQKPNITRLTHYFIIKLEFNQHLFPDQIALLQAGLNSEKSLHNNQKNPAIASFSGTLWLNSGLSTADNNF